MRYVNQTLGASERIEVVLKLTLWEYLLFPFQLWALFRSPEVKDRRCDRQSVSHLQQLSSLFRLFQVNNNKEMLNNIINIMVSMFILLIVLTVLPPDIILLAILLLYGILYVIRWSTEYVVTNERAIIKLGFIARESNEIDLRRVESIDINQGYVARILGFGNIIVTGFGGKCIEFRNVADVVSQYRTIKNLI